MTRLHLDYEVASKVDLKKSGAYRYAEDTSTRILMLGWAFDDDPEQLWLPDEQPLPLELREALTDPSVRKHAFNAQFERLITRHCLGVEVPYDQWRCTMVEAYYLGFAGGLDQVLKAVGLEQKDDRGKRLINVFCKPAPKNHKAEWYTKENKPDEWAAFCEYCRQDVRAERTLYHYLRRFPGMHDWDWRQWCLDQSINDRGVPMDLQLADAAILVWDQEKRRLTAELSDMTGLQKVTRGPFTQWIEDNTGVRLDNLRKDYIASLMTKGELPEEARPYIDLWAQKEGKATSKYTAVVNALCADGRARGMFQYKGASRTDRVGGRLIQLQNLKRPIEGDSPLKIENIVNAIKAQDVRFLRLLYTHSVSDMLGGSVRHVIEAPAGKVLAVCDLTSIESVVLGWIAQCPSIDDTFRAGRDSYKTFASKYYAKPYEDVTKAERSFSKPPVLGCGFMLGWKGLIAYAEGYGVDMTQEQAKTAVDTFRGMYPEIPAFWRWVYDAVKVVTTTHQVVTGYRMTIERDDEFLRIHLPSGRALSYHRPEVVQKVAPWAEFKMTSKCDGASLDDFLNNGWTKEQMIEHGYAECDQILDNFSYMGMDTKNRWTRITAHAGGITENIVQSIAGDILWNGLTKADAAGLKIVLHVHDEIAVEADAESGPHALAALQKCMTDQPPWCSDMWLGADGFLTKRYTKD